MPVSPKRKSDAARWANQTIYRRTMLVMLLLGIAVFILLIFRLYHLQVNRREELQVGNAIPTAEGAGQGCGPADPLRRGHGFPWYDL